MPPVPADNDTLWLLNTVPASVMPACINAKPADSDIPFGPRIDPLPVRLNAPPAVRSKPLLPEVAPETVKSPDVTTWS